MGIERPRQSSTHRGLGRRAAPRSSSSVIPAPRWGAYPTLVGLRRRRRRLGRFPLRPPLSPPCLSLQPRRDRPEPRAAGPGAWTETGAGRRALPCGGKWLSALSPGNFQESPGRGALTLTALPLPLPLPSRWLLLGAVTVGLLAQGVLAVSPGSGVTGCGPRASRGWGWDAPCVLP